MIAVNQPNSKRLDFFVPQLCGYLSIVLGIELVLGWLLQNEAMVKILPSSNSVSFNTAVALIFAGSCLVHRGVLWRKCVSVMLTVGASVILYENIFDVALGVDWETLHGAIQDGSPRPGRVAPNTCLTLMLLGVGLFASTLTDSGKKRWLVPGCCGLQLVPILTGIIGLMLDPTLLYDWYTFNRMAAPTAFGLSLLVLGMYSEYRVLSSQETYSSLEQQRNILWNGTLILLAMGLAGSITTAIIFANYQQESIRERLRSDLLGQGLLAEAIIVQASEETKALSARPLLYSLIRKVAENQTPADRESLEYTLERLLQQGFSSVSMRWADGSAGMDIGLIENPIEMVIALREPIGGELLWRKQGFFFRGSSDEVSVRGTLIGRITTERYLPALSQVYAPVNASTDSSEASMCGRQAHTIACFPSKFRPTPWLLPPLSERERLALDDALDGRAGVRHAKDYRGVAALVAYSPLGATGLAIMSKIDTTDIYHPINNLIWRSFVVLAVSLVVGVVLLRRIVGPLVNAIAQTEARASNSERRLKAITDNVPALIGFIDKELRYRFMNAAYARWFGKPIVEMIDKSPQQLLGDTWYAAAKPNMQRALDGEIVRFSYANHDAGGEHPRYVSATYIPDLAADGSVLGFNVLAFDVTEQNEHAQSLTHLANHDTLTELPNRRLFNDRIARALVRSQRSKGLIGLLYLDIDHFKLINDTHGHECGDLLLQAVAKRLSASVRDSDTVARLGGDEFVVLMEGLHDRGDAEAVAEKILLAIRQPVELNGIVLSVTTSIGLAYSMGNGDTAELFLKRSDSALYGAKVAGRNNVYTDQSVGSAE